MVPAETLLQRIEFAVVSQPLNRFDHCPIGLWRQHHAALHQLAVQNDRARAATACIAADVSSRQIKGVSQEVNEELARLDGPTVEPPIDGDLNHVCGSLLGHLRPPSSMAASTARRATTLAIFRR